RRVRVVSGAVDILRSVRRTRVVLAAAHRDHDTAINAGANLRVLSALPHNSRPARAPSTPLEHPVPLQGAG
ncbi:hypothetical protein ABTK93_20420, partial [Acinetobacter baumannii]